MKVEYTSDGILVEVQTSNNPYLNETFKKGFFADKISSSPLDTGDAISLAMSVLAKRLETCELSEMPIIMTEIERAEKLYEKWYADEQNSW